MRTLGYRPFAWLMELGFLIFGAGWAAAVAVLALAARHNERCGQALDWLICLLQP